MPSPPLPPDRSATPVDATARLDAERANLRARVSQLTEDLDSLIVAAQGSNADDEHDPEGQTIAYERSQLSAMLSQTREHLAEVDDAAARVVAGTYGVCEVCGQLIAAARLEARPTARTCVHHVPDSTSRSR